MGSSSTSTESAGNTCSSTTMVWRMKEFMTAASGESPGSEAIARIEEPLRAIGETLETPYDSEYISRKDAVLRAAGFEVLRLRSILGSEHEPK